MADKQALTYKTATLLQVLREKKEERVQKRQEAADKKKDSDATKIDQLVSLFEKYPTFFRDLVHRAESLVGDHVEKYPTVGTDDFPEAVRRMYSYADGSDEYNPDEDIDRLIRVYERAEDKEVKVDVSDEVFRYL